MTHTRKVHAMNCIFIPSNLRKRIGDMDLNRRLLGFMTGLLQKFILLILVENVLYYIFFSFPLLDSV